MRHAPVIALIPAPSADAHSLTTPVCSCPQHQNRCIGELSFRAEVRAVRLRRDRVVVALDRRVYTYNFADLTLVDHLETAENPRGLCAVCASPTSNVLACLGAQAGHVRVELYDLRKTTLIAAHETPLACLALNAVGSRLATASEKGTLVRIYDTVSGELLQELRRGTDKAEIFCLAFNAGSTMLACTSDKGTVHIFRLNEAVAQAVPASSSSSAGTASGSAVASSDAAAGAEAGGVVASPAAALTTSPAPALAPAPASEPEPEPLPSAASAGAIAGAGSILPARDALAAAGGGIVSAGLASDGEANKGGAFSFMKTILPRYFSSEWSFAQFRVPEGKSICAFGSEPFTVIVISGDGQFFKANFQNGGEAVRTCYAQLTSSTSGGTGGFE